MKGSSLCRGRALLGRVTENVVPTWTVLSRAILARANMCGPVWSACLVKSTQAAYAGLACPWPSSHSTQHEPRPSRQRTRAGLPHVQVLAGNILAALRAGMSWFLAETTGRPQTLHVGFGSIVRWASPSRLSVLSGLALR